VWQPKRRIRQPWQQRRFVLYEYKRVQQARQVLAQPAVLQALLQQLANCISSLQDEEIADIDSLLRSSSSQQQQQQNATAAKDWRSLVAVQPVTEGHRAYDAAAAQQRQLLAVHARVAFQPGQLLGLYLGHVFDSDEVERRGMFNSAADRERHRYQYTFAVKAPVGAERQPMHSSSSSNNTNTTGADDSNTPGPKQQQQQQQTTHFLIDATCCLEGNPLAHMLDYRAFERDSSSGRLAIPLAEQRSSSVAGGPNAMLLPLSDNSGKVYCAVMARCTVLSWQHQIRTTSSNSSTPMHSHWHVVLHSRIWQLLLHRRWRRQQQQQQMRRQQRQHLNMLCQHLPNVITQQRLQQPQLPKTWLLGAQQGAAALPNHCRHFCWLAISQRQQQQQMQRRWLNTLQVLSRLQRFYQACLFRSQARLTVQH
jgi:hypothetical protein